MPFRFAIAVRHCCGRTVTVHLASVIRPGTCVATSANSTFPAITGPWRHAIGTWQASDAAPARQSSATRNRTTAPRPAATSIHLSTVTVTEPRSHRIGDSDWGTGVFPSSCGSGVFVGIALSPVGCTSEMGRAAAIENGPSGRSVIEKGYRWPWPGPPRKRGARMGRPFGCCLGPEGRRIRPGVQASLAQPLVKSG